MTKAKYLSIITLLVLLTYLFENNAYADVPSSPVGVPGVTLLVIGLIIVGVGVFAWLIIRMLNKK